MNLIFILQLEPLTEKIMLLLSDDKLRLQFGRKAQDHAMARWDYNVMNGQLKELYNGSIRQTVFCISNNGIHLCTPI